MNHLSICLMFPLYMFFQHGTGPDSIDPAGVASHHHRARQRSDWREVLGTDVLSLPRTRACFEQIEQDPFLAYRLPKKPSMLPGQILKHCYEVVDNVLDSQSPCIYKVGLTHDPRFRYHSQKFGYRHELDKWEKMIVLHASIECVSCGYIEAAIIHRQWGFLIAKEK